MHDWVDQGKNIFTYAYAKQIILWLLVSTLQGRIEKWCCRDNCDEYSKNFLMGGLFLICLLEVVLKPCGHFLKKFCPPPSKCTIKYTIRFTWL